MAFGAWVCCETVGGRLGLRQAPPTGPRIIEQLTWPVAPGRIDVRTHDLQTLADVYDVEQLVPHPFWIDG